MHIINHMENIHNLYFLLAPRVFYGRLGWEDVLRVVSTGKTSPSANKTMER